MVEPKKIAVIGGGVAGLYTAYRIKSDTRKAFDVQLFEADNRVGGRILSQDIPGLPFHAELGAMRFPPRHKLLGHLLASLGIETCPFDIEPPTLYVRGRYLSLSELKKGACHRCGAGVPFNLLPHERGLSPIELVRKAIDKLLEELSFPGLEYSKAQRLKLKIKEGKSSPEIWQSVAAAGRIRGIPLYGIGFWNFLQHYLSNEAYLLLHTSLSLDSVLGNWSAAEAIPWFLSDFASDTLLMVSEGFGRLTDKLEERLGPVVQKRRVVRKLETKSNQKWEVIFDDNESQEFDIVVLALPTRALEKIELPRESRPDWLTKVRPHRLYKLFLLYEEPWWMGETGPGFDTGRVFTDLPLRQIYYFSPRWMKRRSLDKSWPLIDGAENWALVMASYSDEHFVSFWHSSSGLESPTDGELELQYGAPYYRRPMKINSRGERRLLNTVKDVRLRARERTVSKVQKQLREIHGESVPEPILGVFKDWGDDPYGGGWHTWEIGTEPGTVQGWPKLSEGVPDLYLCGEAYSPEQGWIEGALRSSEAVLLRLGIQSPDNWPHWESLGDYVKLHHPFPESRA